MTDVRLTALNPVDSQVYPVACNTSGELIVADDGIDYLPLTGGELTGPLTSTSSITTAGNIVTGDYNPSSNTTSGAQLFNSGNIYLQHNGTGPTNYDPFRIYYGTTVKASFSNQGNLTAGSITATGKAEFGTTSKATFFTNGEVQLAGNNVNFQPSGSATFAGAVVSKGVNAAVCFQAIQTNAGEVKVEITASGTATFAGNVTAPNITSLNTSVEELQTKMSLIMRQIDISAETP